MRDGFAAQLRGRYFNAASESRLQLVFPLFQPVKTTKICPLTVVYSATSSFHGLIKMAVPNVNSTKCFHY